MRSGMKENHRSYSEKLRDPRWQRRRLEIMQRDDFACCECHATHKTLNVHHRFYLRGLSPWEYKPEWLQTLCEDCHDAREASIEKLHRSLLLASTGDLIVWSKRISRERKAPKRALNKQAKIVASSVPVILPAPLATLNVWDQMRAAANGLVKLQEIREGLNA